MPEHDVSIGGRGRGGSTRALAENVSDMYRSVFSLPPFSGDTAEFANQRSTTRS